MLGSQSAKETAFDGVISSLLSKMHTAAPLKSEETKCDSLLEARYRISVGKNGTLGGQTNAWNSKCK